MESSQEFFTIKELAELWKLSRWTIRRLIKNEPGVLVLDAKHRLNRKTRRTFRIPLVVVERLQNRMVRR